MEPEVNNVKTVKNNFRRGYGMIPGDYQTEVRDEIMKLCGWESFVTFSHKKNGIVSIRPPEITIIESVFSEYQLNPWTGERIAS